VTAQLIDAEDGCHLWSERYDRELTDVFAVQEEIAAAITSALYGGALIGKPGVTSRYAPPLPAYEAYLRGRHHMFRQTADSLPQAVAYYEKAIALDPNYWDPRIELAASHMLLWFHGVRFASEMMPLVRRAAQFGITLAPQHGAALLGVVAAANDYEWRESRQLFERGLLETAGFHAEARWMFAVLHLCPQGKFDEAVALMRHALQDDPLSVLWRTAVADFQIKAGDYEGALRELSGVCDIDPNYWPAHFLSAKCHAASGRLEDAFGSAERLSQLAPWHARSWGLMSALHHVVGRAAEAETLLRRLRDPGAPPAASVGLIEYGLMTGDLVGVADAYERAIAERHAFVVTDARSVFIEPLRRTPRWPALAALMRLPS